MRVLEQKEIIIEWGDLESRVRHDKPNTRRSKGVRHVSGVLKHIAVTTRMLKASEIDDEEMPLKMCLGVMVEEGLVGLYPHLEWQPGEVKRDGITGSPDGLSDLNYPESCVPPKKPEKPKAWCIEEFKFTYYSCRTRPITEYWLWLNQVMAYCAMHRERPRLARLHVLYVCGDYSRPFVPRYMRYLIEFEKREIEDCWQMILRHSNEIEAEI